MLLLALLNLPSPALALDVTPTGGAAGGLLVHGADNPLPTSPTVVGRVGLQFDERWSTELNLGWAWGETRDRAFPYVLFDPRLDVLCSLTPGKRVNLFLRGGLGIEQVTSQREDDPDTIPNEEGKVREGDSLWEFGPGLMVNVAGPVWLRTDLLFVPSFGDHDVSARTDTYPNLEWTVGVDFRRPANTDKDDDGIKDKVDACPEAPEDKDGFQDEDGCPEMDNDGDGLDDNADTCPNDPEDKDDFEDSDGCPDPDNDGDGVADTADQCPQNAEDKDGFEDEDGCPDPDNDKDNIVDARDKCPNEAEVKNGYQDFDGCPDEIPEAVAKFTGVIEGITFDTNKTTIRKSSEKTLEGALKVLTDFPDVRLEVEGHTDNVGDDAKNLTLSQGRAQAVVDWFVAKGIAADRLTAKGYGETKPRADNATKAGQAENRRVEFKLVSEEAKPEAGK